MKNRRLGKLGVITGVAILCLLTLLCGISLGAIYNITDDLNPHNLSAVAPGGFTFMTMQVCVFCHTPHGANTEVHESTFWNSAGYQNTNGNGSYLLWNRDIDNSPSYRTYQSLSMDSNPQQVRIHSLLCMSCHDGVSAMNVMTNLPNESPAAWGEDPYAGPGGGLTLIGGSSKMSDGYGGTNIGERTASGDPSDLANDHPVSFDYTDTLATDDGELHLPGDIAPELRLFYSPDTDDYTSMECSTCHDVHTSEKPGYKEPNLVMSNQNSAMCLSCHIK